MKLRAFRPSRCTHVLNDREGALAHAKEMKGNPSNLQGALMHSRVVQFFMMKECTQEENLYFLGTII